MIKVALNHRSTYQYDQNIALGPHVIRLRPAPHCRTPIHSYSLKVNPGNHFLNWHQDPHGNFLARLIFPDTTKTLEIEVDLVAEMTVINPFDFFLEEQVEEFPFEYDAITRQDLKPYLAKRPHGQQFDQFFGSIDRSKKRTIDFLIELNQIVQQSVNYLVRLEPGVQTPAETLASKSGSCRDSAWLLAALLREFGLAARFVSGYLIQLKPDQKSLDGPSGAEADFTDLHAWVEVYLPGAGWIGLDPTSGLVAGEGHIPVACTPDPTTAAPVSGTVGKCKVDFQHAMTLTRVHEDPRVTKPYSPQQWTEIDALGRRVDQRLSAGDVRLTMGGEPTFVSIDDMEGDEWTVSAVGPTKRALATNLVDRLSERFAAGGLVHYGQGKWYPGESLPRWAMTGIWRLDGQPIWKNKNLLASPDDKNDTAIHNDELPTMFARQLADNLGVNAEHVRPAYEDPLDFLWRERRLPVNTALKGADLDDDEERARLARIYERGVTKPAGCILPLMHQWAGNQARWNSGHWPIRSEHLFLVPGDSPMGLRLPLDSLPAGQSSYSATVDVPFEPLDPLPGYEQIRKQMSFIQIATRPRSAIHQQYAQACLLYTYPSPRDQRGTRMPSSA